MEVSDCCIFAKQNNNWNTMFFNREHTRTSFIQLDTQKCKACWKCIKNCPNQVIGKVDFFMHKHALIVNPDACTGCLSCISICKYEAYSIHKKTNHDTDKKRNGMLNNFLVNNLLLLCGLVTIFSGMVLQIGFHMGHDRTQAGSYGIQQQSIQYEQMRQIDTNKIVCGFNYTSWSDIHKVVIVCFSMMLIYHTYIHWKWYKGVITKNLINKNSQVIILTTLFLLVAATGFIPWFIDLSGGTSDSRMLFIEIHDKLTFVLIVFLVLHFVKRAKWYTSTYLKLKG